MSPDPGQTELLKALYEENATMFRFHLTWRQLLLAGYFVVLATLALAFRWSLLNTHGGAAVFPFIGAAVSAFFWALDHRNRTLYGLASATGSALESAFGLPVSGYYGTYKGTRAIITHTWVLSLLYIGCGALLFVLGILTAKGFLIPFLPQK
jgi:hypothetical protein